MCALCKNSSNGMLLSVHFLYVRYTSIKVYLKVFFFFELSLRAPSNLSIRNMGVLV